MNTPLKESVHKALDPLKDFFIAENYALDVKNRNLQREVKRLKRQVLITNHQMCSRNHMIAQIQDRYELLQRFHQQQMNLQRVLVNIDNTLHVFKRNQDGVFVQVDESPEMFEEVPTTEEDPEEIARRLDYDSQETDSEVDDDLMRRLLYGDNDE
jgi:hypothetical protein